MADVPGWIREQQPNIAAGIVQEKVNQVKGKPKSDGVESGNGCSSTPLSKVPMPTPESDNKLKPPYSG